MFEYKYHNLDDFDESTKRILQSSNYFSWVLGNLMEMGMPANLRGFFYLRTAVALVLSDPTYMKSITGRLYNDTGKLEGTTGSRVERAIRHAIDITFEKGNSDILYIMFRNSVNPDTGRPSNGSFISALSEKIRIDLMKGELTLDQ